MAREPLRFNVPIVQENGVPTEQFQRLWSQLPTTGGGGGGGTVTSVSFSTDFSSTPNPVTTTGSVALSTTGVTAASYTLASITVDSKGRITSASNGTISGIDLDTQTVGDLDVTRGGVPTGGTTGQALVKASNTDYDVAWATGTAGGDAISWAI